MSQELYQSKADRICRFLLLCAYFCVLRLALMRMLPHVARIIPIDSCFCTERIRISFNSKVIFDSHFSFFTTKSGSSQMCSPSIRSNFDALGQESSDQFSTLLVTQKSGSLQISSLTCFPSCFDSFRRTQRVNSHFKKRS